MRQLNVLSLFHLNLAFSSIEEEQRPDVIARCYWPLLRLPDAIGAPIAIEATGYTLETIHAIDPAKDVDEQDKHSHSQWLRCSKHQAQPKFQHLS